MPSTTLALALNLGVSFVIAVVIELCLDALYVK